MPRKRTNVGIPTISIPDIYTVKSVSKRAQPKKKRYHVEHECMAEVYGIIGQDVEAFSKEEAVQKANARVEYIARELQSILGRKDLSATGRNGYFRTVGDVEIVDITPATQYDVEEE